MRRREFLVLVGCAAAWPLSIHAQQPVTPLIGFLGSGSASAFGDVSEAFQQGLQELGYQDGRNIAIEFRWADGQYDRLPGLAAELVMKKPNVMVASGANVSALAVAKATTNIPIVFIMGDDPVRLGLVPNFGRPGGNVTGVTQLLAAGLSGKRIQLLRELFPNAKTVGILINPSNPAAEIFLKSVLDAASAMGQAMRVFRAGDREGSLEEAFASLVRERVDALALMPDSALRSQQERIISLANRHSVPVMDTARSYPDAGGLMSYGSNGSDAYRLAGTYAGRILAGERPGELPVLQPTKYELVINLKTAKALGITVPPSLLARADEVIE